MVEQFLAGAEGIAEPWAEGTMECSALPAIEVRAVAWQAAAAEE